MADILDSLDGPDAASLRRQGSMKNRQYGLYASHIRNPQKQQPRIGFASEGVASSATTDSLPPASIFSTPTSSTSNAPSDARPHIPFPTPARWDDPNSTAFDVKDIPFRPPCGASNDRNQDTPADFLLPVAQNGVDDQTMTGKAMVPKHASPDSQPPTAERGPVDNFSRPRKSSIKQPQQDLARQRLASGGQHGGQFDQSFLLSFDPPSSSPPVPPPKARERGISVSSAQSASTYASVPGKGAVDYMARMRAPAAGNANAATTVSRPPLLYSRAESNGSALYRDQLPWLPSDEVRASFRSQLTVSTTMSTTQGTLLTERSSVMTKSSSVTSYAGADEPSVEDVMGMYERGFRDDSDVEDNEESRPPTAGSSLSRRGAQILEAMNEPLPVPTFARSIAGASHVQVRDSAAMFRNSGLPSSLPKGVGNLDYHMGGGSVPKYDSDTESIKMFRAATKLAAPSGLSRREEDLRDRYGFKKQTQHVTLEQYEAWNEQYTAYLSRRRRKWVALMKDCGLMTESPDRFPPRSAKTKRFVRKGIPPEWRGAAWFYYAGGPAIVAKHPGLYDELTRKRAKDVDIELIERDLHRTFPDNIKFRPQRNAKASSANRPDTTDASFDDSDADAAGPEPPIITSLRRVLQAFSIYNPRIGYCQSLNFLAGLLLLFVQTEEQAFWLLNVITRLYLPGTHEMSLEGSRIDLGVLMAELKEALPQVWAKIAGELDGTTGAQTATADRERDSKKRRSSSRRKESQPPASRSGAGLSSAGDRAGPGNVERLPPITLCMTAWFMSCFIGTLPIETTLRVWDVFFYEGSKTLFRIALAIFKLGEAEIRAVSDPMEMFGVVQAIPRRILDANLLMETCFRRRGGFGGLSQETIERGRRERREAGKRGSASTDGTTANSNAGEVSANNDDAVAASAAAEVKRKGTLFGRRKERGREREREVEAL